MGACGVRKSTIVELRDPRHAGAYIHCPRLSLQHILAVRRKCYIRISGGPFAAVPPTVQEEYDQHYIDMGRFSALSSYQGFLPLLRILLTREPSINVFLSQLWVTITTESAQWNEDTKCLSRIMAATLTDFAVMMRRSDFNRTSERTFWVESVVPMFKYFAAETNYITFSWCGADVVSHSDSQLIPGVWLNETTQLLADGLGQAGRFEVLIMESSSGYEQEIPQRTVDGTIKVTRCMIDSLRMERNKYNFASFETAKRLATFGIQCVCNKITLLQANMFDENTWQIVEVRSAEIPTKWEDRTAMMSVAEFLAKLQVSWLQNL
ncbi:hypothetical protein BCR43DRAFT_434869 [Syncephalastrum racemosum]|uniref:Uncharacterized protein n=1 Tax=Syncephalastrum racemosum TaxID=13706 RepID=A0A1X2HS37_SYNRA|nr:hypothetical protein BCR43DRAFT_434869 [Syncephalastrum racemosum]